MDLIKHYTAWSDTTIHATTVSMEKKPNTEMIGGWYSALFEIGLQSYYQLTIEADNLSLNKILTYSTSAQFKFNVKFKTDNAEVTIKLNSAHIQQTELISKGGKFKMILNVSEIELEANEWI